MTPRALASADARQRALRTLRQGGTVILGAALPVLVTWLAGGVRWTAAWWAGLAGAVATAALTAGASWLDRLVSPPAPLPGLDTAVATNAVAGLVTMGPGVQATTGDTAPPG